MKKSLVLFVMLALLSVSSFAQSKGAKFFGVSALASVESTSASAYGHNSTVTSTQLALGVELGYFITDKASLSLGISVPYVDQDGSSNGLGVNIAPRITSYFYITDNVYYSPSFCVSYETGKVKNDGDKYNYKAYGFLFDLFGLSVKVRNNISLYITLAPFGFVSTKTGDIKANQFSMKLNSGTLGVRFDL